MSRSAWLTYRGELSDYFSDPQIRNDIIKYWNDQHDYPRLTQYFSDGHSFVSYFEARVGLRPNLLETMYVHAYIPSFGLSGLNELHQEACRILGNPYVSFNPQERRDNQLPSVPVNSRDQRDKWSENLNHIISFFDSVNVRNSVTNSWNRSNVPQITRHYDSGVNFLTFFDSKELKSKLIAHMLECGYIPLYATAVLLREIKEQLDSKAPDLGWLNNATVDCRSANSVSNENNNPSRIDRHILDQQYKIEQSLPKKTKVNDESKKKNSHVCPICFDEEDVNSLVDCNGGHVYCHDCANDIINGKKICSICQHPVTKVTIVRFSYLE